MGDLIDFPSDLLGRFQRIPSVGQGFAGIPNRLFRPAPNQEIRISRQGLVFFHELPAVCHRVKRAQGQHPVGRGLGPAAIPGLGQKHPVHPRVGGGQENPPVQPAHQESLHRLNILFPDLIRLPGPLVIGIPGRHLGGGIRHRPFGDIPGPVDLAGDQLQKGHHPVGSQFCFGPPQGRHRRRGHQPGFGHHPVTAFVFHLAEQKPDLPLVVRLIHRKALISYNFGNPDVGVGVDMEHRAIVENHPAGSLTGDDLVPVVKEHPRLRL